MTRCSLFGFFCLISFNSTVFADEPSAGHYLLPKFGIMSVDLNNADPLISVGLLYGIGLTETISFEAELNYGFSGGEHVKDSVKGEYRISTLAGYGVYRFPVTDNTYLKGKLGLLFEDIERNLDNGEAINTDDFGVAGGVGIGTQFGNMATVEIEATLIDKNIIFYSLGAHYRF